MKLHKTKNVLAYKKPRFSANKRASMQLSINAIVILVMAMAVLGIGLGLIRGVLAPAQDNLEEAIGKVDLSEKATSSKPIANLPSTLNLKSSAPNEVLISFYNKQNDCPDAEFNIACEGASITRTQSLEINTPQGSAETLIGVFEPGSVSGKKPCEVVVTCNDEPVESKAIFVSFNS